MTQFFYGTFFHAENEIAFESVTRSIQRGQSGRAWILNVNWQLKGKLLGSSDSIMNQLNLRQLAYSQDGQSAGLIVNGQISPFIIKGQQSLGGIRITSPISHGPIMGAELATYLHYKIGLEADFAWAFAEDPLEFQETLTFTNNEGGPIYIERLPFSGPPILPQVTEQSWFFVTQQGSLTQAGSQPRPMPPVFDRSFIRTGGNSGQQIRYSSPRTIRGAPVSYKVEWKYEFISDAPLIGWPNTVG